MENLGAYDKFQATDWDASWVKWRTPGRQWFHAGQHHRLLRHKQQQDVCKTGIIRFWWQVGVTSASNIAVIIIF